MRVLIIGSGGREHAMARAICTASAVELFVAPGNPGTAALGHNVAIAADDLAGLAALVRSEKIDLCIPGPEAPLCAGIVDTLVAETGVLCVGPSAAAAQLEGSKAFARQLTESIGVLGPRSYVVRSRDALIAAIDALAAIAELPPVLKADGLCAGKGVFLPSNRQECIAQGEALLAGRLGAAGRTLVVEERLVGGEASLFFACHGEKLVALPHARDYKRAGDGDTGLNTGGMGAVSPNPALSATICEAVADAIVRPTLFALSRRGTPFVGFLFVGVMLTAQGPRLLEFNVRLGDPEAQAILPRLGDGDFLRLCVATARGDLDSLRLRIDPRSTCAVVLAAQGYPEAPRLGGPLRLAVERPSARLRDDECWFIHAGTIERDDELRIAGGRVGAVVARAESAAAAQALAYSGVRQVIGRDLIYRRDIGEVIKESIHEQR